MTDTELLNELEKRAEAYHDKVKKDFAIEELEKIKAEIEKMRSKQNCSCSDCLDILDNHIEELKGEQK